MDHKLWYEETDLNIIDHADADFASDEADRHSITNFVFLLGKGVIS